MRVGAAALCDDGHVVSGCNVENASFGLTLCAECGLVSAFVASGRARLVAVSITAGDGRPLAPCGRCRQLLMEHGGPGLLLDGGPASPRSPWASCCRAPSTAPSSGTAVDQGARTGRPFQHGGGGAMSARGRPVGHFDAVDLIRAKRDGGELTDEEIGWLVDAYVAGTVPDEQVSALLDGRLLPGHVAA